MRPVVLAAVCAAGLVGSYLAWIAAVADDYDGGFKHFAALATGVLAWIFAAGFVIAAGWGLLRLFRAKRPSRTPNT